jgi:hypothetical protein
VWLNTNISEESAAFIFNVNSEVENGSNSSFCLEYWMMDKVQKTINSETEYKNCQNPLKWSVTKQSYLHLQFVFSVYFYVTQVCCSVFEKFERFCNMDVGSTVTDKYAASLKTQ